MENIQERKEMLLKELEEINTQITDEVIKNATNEELIEFANIAEEIRKKIAIIENM